MPFSTPMPGESPIRIAAADGYTLHGTLFQPAGQSASSSLAIINCATGVKAAYYARYARFLATHGFTALTYDYRGIGASRPHSLKGFRASKYDWGHLDFEGVLRWAMPRFEQNRIAVVGHSIGGVVPGFAPSNHGIHRMLTVGAQFAYWRDYKADQRRHMFWQWHIAMPLLTMAAGYFPGKRLGWLEDLPAGVALEWALRSSSLERASPAWIRRKWRLAQSSEVTRHFAGLRAPILAYGVSDDPFGTPAAIHRLLRYFTGSHRTYVEVSPADLRLPAIGHFAFFHDRFSASLWKESLIWLADGKVQRPPAAVLAPSSSRLADLEIPA
ncbi:alpha/beta fold hydrolase [Paucimonas lemoignei]|uniref:alpha/beta hydrolase family protein n=1 Tax=Paucimonas lemoignei TaxID=29443 RepID=UPI001FB1C825|nr:alpha/beta fold hydrolase [Paucimonas lemoignei]